MIGVHKKNIWIKVVVILVVLIAGIVFISLFSGRNVAEDDQTAQVGNANRIIDAKLPPRQIIPIEAEGGKISPSILSYRKDYPVSLLVKAVDRSIVFKIEKSGISYEIAKGSSVEIDVDGLGFGTYAISCGPGCSGTINILELGH